MDYEKMVKETEPTAYVKVEGSLRIIARPRRKEDGPALVKYVLLSEPSYTSAGAWESALKRRPSLTV
jgi:hypothetical protein